MARRKFISLGDGEVFWHPARQVTCIKTGTRQFIDPDLNPHWVDRKFLDRFVRVIEFPARRPETAEVEILVALRRLTAAEACDRIIRAAESRKQGLLGGRG